MAEASQGGLKLDWRIDLGAIITAVVMIVGFCVQYGILANRVSSIESQVLQASVILHSMESRVERVQTQIEDEREHRREAEQERERAARDHAEIHAK